MPSKNKDKPTPKKLKTSLELFKKIYSIMEKKKANPIKFKTFSK